ncbi:putative ssDNA exonuclease, 5'--_ 3'-specific(Bacterial RecJ exonuclease,41-586) [Magnetospirillum sp. XM-1]|uniref:single-stranded-DNA-specific exonuclease RecJ n=1 Tax=Magnetospirillum sp. XM-1 TaxID=1663591 RepID=UPI00073DBDD4|nr:single-stranded-DNA-specific exonuclease RecJ [Magnetospirillum sp. XM-1]CUW38663.1 putative ssDNA exonuclease, 5'--> 3'-specific(Bacterial RecJ exonuclease,41-586) [Magnetospirillum sp. XM-1]
MSHTQPAFLGVERSLSGRRWLARPGDERLALALSQRLGLPELVGRVLASRGVGLDEAERFLNPTLKDLLPDPGHLKGMEQAVERLVRAVTRAETIGIFGDYDVDGATSSALLKNAMDGMGARTRVYIPDRIKEGYGPNAPALLRLKDEGVGVVVTVDCGTTAFDALETATQAGLDMIVVDHHVGETALPAALAVINPNRLDETSPHGHMAAVGVAFLLAVGLNRGLKQAGWYASRPAPDLMRWLDLVALGTVCDVVPLVGVNRALVVQGLKVMARRGNVGLAALADVAGVKERPDSYTLGYVLGPRVNAGGRVGEAELGTRLMSTDNPAEAAEIARQLDGYNKDRQEIEAAVLYDAIEQVEGRPDDGRPLLIAAGENWHPGVIGIVAGRLKERYGRVACVVALEGDQGKGSGRSVSGLDLGSAIIAARQAGLLRAGGGHAMAAGFTVACDKLDALSDFLAERLQAQLEGELVPLLELDGALDAGAAGIELVETLSQVGPFGSGNPEPRFAISGARIARADVVGSGHVRLMLAGAGGKRLKAIAFRAADSEMGHALLSSAGAAFHLAGTLRVDTWQGNSSVQLIVDDAAIAR